jgi:hypothetical protein
MYFVCPCSLWCSRVVGMGGGQEEARPSDDAHDTTQHAEVGSSNIY